MAIELSRNLALRVISALVLLPPVIGAVYLGGWYFYAFILVAGGLMVLEWNRMIKCHYPLMDVLSLFAVAAAALTVPAADWGISNGAVIALAVIVPLCAVALYLEFGRLREGEHDKQPIAYSILGTSLIAAAIAAIGWLRTLDSGQLVMWLLLCVWAMDVGGYFAGKGIGGPKMSPRISPNKTWAGLLGGTALAASISYIFALIAGWPLHLWITIAGGVVAVVAQGGDLYESAVKRRFSIKDSGELIPGHGGILDRVDGLLAAAPAAALFIAFHFLFV